MGDRIEKLYANYEILSDALAKGKISEHEAAYQEILNAVHGDEKEKKLASQFIGKYFKHFPKLAETAMDRQLDLCEDEDVNIRRQAIKDLPALCKDNKEYTPKIADILAQLLVSEDPTELQTVHLSLQNVAKNDVLGTLTGIFSQISIGDESTRSKSLDYLLNKFVKFNTELIDTEVEQHLVSGLKKVLQDVTADEFHACMQILAKTKLARTVSGHLELVKICSDQAELEVSLTGTMAAEDEVVERFIFCATEALPYFSRQVNSNKFVAFMCEKLLPVQIWNLIGAADDQSQTQLRLLKIFAELCTHVTSFGDDKSVAEKYASAIYNVLLEYMPLPPVDVDLKETPSFQFSHAECLLYALHTIGKQVPEFLAFPSDPQKLKDSRARLQYLARGTTGYLKKLQESLKGKIPAELKSEENQIKVTALKTTSNISTIIRDLFHTPPSYKVTIILSWLAPKMKDLSAAAKRRAITFSDNQAKKMKNDAPVYAPPSGKYSANVKNFTGKEGGGRGGRRNFRGGRRNKRF